ncbi:Lrp/AsnC family transcriptional regulator [Nanoarchaeota archaeon]
MDAKDNKILAILDLNSRSNSSEIAKKVGLSRQVVEYRIKQLVKNKIILNFMTLIDPTKFADNIWHVYIKLQNLTEESEKRIHNYLLKKKEVWWIAKCQGEYDLVFSIAGDDIIAFDHLISEFRAGFHPIINQLHITSLIKVDSFPRGYFLNTETNKNTYVGERKKVKIDEKDLAILKILATNSRKPATEIAELTDLTSRQVIYRIKELEKKEVIRHYRLHLNLQRINYDYYKVCFHTQDFTESTEKSILSWCEVNPNVVYYIKKISPWTFEIEFEAESYRQLNKILQDLRNKFGNTIKRTETTLICEEFKGELDILKAALL